MKRSLLFVDDEPRVLQALQRNLLPHRSVFDMTFVTSGQEALDKLDAAPFDVIVTDMRMPGMDGATLLLKLKDKFPGMIRIVLSGQSEQEAALRSIAVTHQFLSKPCAADKLREIIDRLCNLRSLLGQGELSHVIAKIANLPTMPRTYQAITQAIAQDASLKVIAKLIEQDSALCAKVLQIVNSAFFGMSRRITDVTTAVSALGMSTLRNVVLTSEVFRDIGNAKNAKLIEALQNHAVLAAGIAKNILLGTPLADDAYVAAILHDVGRLILVSNFPKESAEIDKAVKAGDREHVAEERILGTTHAEIGAYLLGLWGLPYPIVEAVANHHHRERIENPQLDLVAAVYLANLLAHEHDQPSSAAEEPDAAYLQAIGATDKLREWREFAKKLATGSPAST